ncbi:transcription factor A, mitochondrial-like [Portunus trituberculatus]|uniref:transcription factor A, mitochondrial-like n=1 Tax=Portunus trituberculatus TaxID=210409 RepID=UPI001E1CCEB5|nr:transcription factor A, mitochondrial-like [Portunus trituberculatus]
MALVRLCVARQSFLGRSFFRHAEAPGVLSVAYKQSVAQQLGLPEPPKRPLAPHVRFIKDRIEDITKQYPKLSSQEVFTKTLDNWKSLNSLEKSKWTSEFNREKELYNALYKAYVEKLSPSQLESIKALKRKRSEDKAKRMSRREKKRESEDLGKPKYPGNAFFLYISTLERGDSTGKEFVKAAAEKWHSLPERTQQIYREKAKKMLEEYNEELCQWEAKMVQKGRVDLVRTNQLGGELREGIRGRKKQN